MPGSVLPGPGGVHMATDVTITLAASLRSLETDVPTYRCPSDPAYGLPGHGRNNYAACIGDAIDRVHYGGTSEFGFFHNNRFTGNRTQLDGYTIVMQHVGVCSGTDVSPSSVTFSTVSPTPSWQAKSQPHWDNAKSSQIGFVTSLAHWLQLASSEP